MRSLARRQKRRCSNLQQTDGTRLCRGVSRCPMYELSEPLTRIPLQERLVFVYGPGPLPQDSRAFTTLGKLPARSTTFVNHGSRHINTLLSKDPDVIFVSICWDGSSVARGRPGNGVRRTLIRLMVRVHIMRLLLLLLLLFMLLLLLLLLVLLVVGVTHREA